jgi:uncharacterized SAM-binding protein YcdF (DUF218 family)
MEDVIGCFTMLRFIAGLILLILIFNPWTLAWLAGQYVVDDGLQPSDTVVALRGDVQEENRRIDEALRVFQQLNARTMLMDVTAARIFEVPEGQLLETYLKSKGLTDAQLAACPNTADSTEEEARALRECFQRLGTRSVTIVTSEYHTRRAGEIFRHELASTGIAVHMHAIYNPNYWNVHWWRSRRWAKTYFLETLKTIWTSLTVLTKPAT